MNPNRDQHARPRILFVAEAVTLAHVSRPAILAQSLDSEKYEVVFAADSRFDNVFGDFPFERRTIHSLPSRDFLAALEKGSPLYNVATLRSYVREDLALIKEANPDLVVGDFRLSLSVSARVAGIPYITITNAYWSPYARTRFPMPDLPMTRILGYRASSWLFRLMRPLAFAWHAVPLNRIRREYGLPSLGYDLRRTYTDADFVLYADVPELVPTYDRPENHTYLGPIVWSPDVDSPPSLSEGPADRPKIYVNLGSSGQIELLPRILQALADLPVFVMAATAGRIQLKTVPANSVVADYLPGPEMAASAALVICNGGSPTTHQALAAGTPVLGIPSNMDQLLNMEAVEGAGAGMLLRAPDADEPRIRESVLQVINQPRFKESSVRLAASFAKHCAGPKFEEVVANVLKDQVAVTGKG